MKCYWQDAFKLRCDEDVRTFRDERGRKVGLCRVHRAWERHWVDLTNGPRHPDGSRAYGCYDPNSPSALLIESRESEVAA